MMFQNMKLSMLFGLILLASLLSFIKALRIPIDGNPKKVQWGINKERIYRLPEGLVPRGVLVPSESEAKDPDSKQGCNCGRCDSCRGKKMMREDAEERLFGFGSSSYGYGSMGYDPYHSYDSYYPQQYYEPYGSYGYDHYDPYYSVPYQYPTYW